MALIRINQCNTDTENLDKKLEMSIKKLDVGSLVAKTLLNTKCGEIENKIPQVTDLRKKTDYDAKIIDIEKKYFTTADYNKFTNETFDANIKQKELVNNSDMSNIIKNSSLNIKLATLATKAELKA